MIMAVNLSVALACSMTVTHDLELALSVVTGSRHFRARLPSVLPRQRRSMLTSGFTDIADVHPSITQRRRSNSTF